MLKTISPKNKFRATANSLEQKLKLGAVNISLFSIFSKKEGGKNYEKGF